MSTELRKEAMALYKGEFYYHPTEDSIYDKNHDLIARTVMAGPTIEVGDEIGCIIAEALTEYWSRRDAAQMGGA